jgi:hypothetical protein
VDGKKDGTKSSQCLQNLKDGDSSGSTKTFQNLASIQIAHMPMSVLKKMNKLLMKGTLAF